MKRILFLTILILTLNLLPTPAQELVQEKYKINGKVEYDDNLIETIYLDADIEHLSDQELLFPWYADKDRLGNLFDMFEKVRDQFTLLLTCSAGTKYHNFQHDFAQKLTEVDYRYYAEAYKRGFATKIITKEQLHIYLTAYWELFYEPIIHGMERSAINDLCAGIERWINWQALLGLPEKMPF